MVGDKMNISEDLIGSFSDELCPKCGSRLLINKRGDKWCSFIGNMIEPSCNYKITKKGTK
jgi:hypothetical protein